MSQNGQQADAMLQQIQAQANAERMLHQMLDNTLRAPAVTKRAATNKVAIVEEPHPSGSDLVPAARVLMVALPTGERWEIPLSPDAARALVRQLGEPEPAA